MLSARISVFADSKKKSSSRASTSTVHGFQRSQEVLPQSFASQNTLFVKQASKDSTDESMNSVSSESSVL